MKLKRLLAYIIDILIVGFVASALANIDILNPYLDNYLESYESFNETLKNINEENVMDMFYSADFVNQYQNTLKYSVYSTGISLVCYLLYFVGFQKWNKNQTVGKKLMNLKVVNKNKKDDVKVWQYLIRTLIVYNLFFSGLNVCLALCFNTKLFFTLSLIVSIIGYVITYFGYGMILFRKDGKGLHDLISGTEVMEVKNVIN